MAAVRPSSTDSVPLLTLTVVLRLIPGDQLAFQTKAQLFVQLDRYPDALALLAAQQDAQASVEQAYCMYKSGREAQALEGLKELDAEVRESRTAMLVEAQVVRTAPSSARDTC